MPSRFPTTIPEAQLAAAFQAEAEGAASTTNEPTGLRALAKADVHCHALLNGPLKAYETVLGHSLPLPPPRFRDFGEFAGYLAANLFPAIRSSSGVRSLLRAGLERMANEGVVYTEASLDLLLPSHAHVPLHTIVDIVAEERDRIAGRLTFAPEIGLNRRIPADRLWPMFVAYVDSGVFQSIDLYDDERSGDLKDFQRLYHYAKDKGMLLKAHAGEICGPERIRETIEVLEVDVIQHGISAVANPLLLEDLARRGTQLNLCLASNIALGLAGSYENHPIRTLLAAGVNVALGTDDFTLFRAGLCDEIRRLRRSGMRVADIAKLRLGAPDREQAAA